MKYVPPSVEHTAFNCPHCQVLTKQFWYSVGVRRKGEDRADHIWTPESVEKALARLEGDWKASREELEKLKAYHRKSATGEVFTGPEDHYGNYLTNVAVSLCQECGRLSVWIYDRLAWPIVGTAPEPNADMPPEVAALYREASAVHEHSPRAAAALLRLAMEGLCRGLGDVKNTFDQNIGLLVQQGLDERVQQMLDIVRVRGNEAVHPGQIDPSDSRETAETLFGLVNLITERWITEEKKIGELFSGLPKLKRDAIARRDGATASNVAAEPVGSEGHDATASEPPRE